MGVFVGEAEGSNHSLQARQNTIAVMWLFNLPLALHCSGKRETMITVAK